MILESIILEGEIKLSLLVSISI